MRSASRRNAFTTRPWAERAGNLNGFSADRHVWKSNHFPYVIYHFHFPSVTGRFSEPMSDDK